MAEAIRVRVTWDDTIVEDRVFVGRRLVRIGAGGRAHIAAPGDEAERYATLRLRGRVLELTVEPGAAARVIFPGEDEIVVGSERVERQLRPPYGSGRLVIVVDGRETRIDFERVRFGAEARDRALVAYAMVALLISFFGAGSYKLVKRLGEGNRTQWGQTPRLDARDVARVRVRLGPDGVGASRPQAGQGVALHGTSQARRVVPPPQVVRARPARRTSAPAPRALPRPDGTQVASRVDGIPSRNPSAVTRVAPQPARSRSQMIEDAQAALLQADLRQAVDSYSSARKTAPLDYDQLNWLGLAHYLSGEYDQARGTWEEARRLDPRRADAINNLASVSKRQGDTAGELTLLSQAMALAPNDCHASNSLALAQAKNGQRDAALKTLADSDANCGGGYAYTSIQKSGILAMAGDLDGALKALELGLQHVDTMVPVKEFEVLTDLTLDPAFARLRARSEYGTLVAQYLPRAASWQTERGAE